MFLGLVAVYSLRGCFNEAIVAMVNQTAVKARANMSRYAECPRDPAFLYERGQFDWDIHQQGALIAAFYYGYISLILVIASLLPHTYMHTYTTLHR